MVITELIGLGLIILVIEVYIDFFRNIINFIIFKFKKR